MRYPPLVKLVYHKRHLKRRHHNCKGAGAQQNLQNDK